MWYNGDECTCDIRLLDGILNITQVVMGLSPVVSVIIYELLLNFLGN